MTSLSIASIEKLFPNNSYAFLAILSRKVVSSFSVRIASANDSAFALLHNKMLSSFLKISLIAGVSAVIIGLCMAAAS